MYRIDNSTAVGSLPSPASPGTAGYFSSATPTSGGTPTIVTNDWCNMIQEEIMSVVLGAGLTPSKTTYNQLLLAIQSYLAGKAASGSNADITDLHALIYGIKMGNTAYVMKLQSDQYIAARNLADSAYVKVACLPASGSGFAATYEQVPTAFGANIVAGGIGSGFFVFSSSTTYSSGLVYSAATIGAASGSWLCIGSASGLPSSIVMYHFIRQS